MDQDFQIEGKECKVHEKFKMWRFLPERVAKNDSVWVDGSERGEVGDSRKKFNEGGKRLKGVMRLIEAEGTSELRQVTRDPATQTLRLRNRKTKS